MDKNTGAFLAIWHGLINEEKAEWERWHTYEHIQERVAIPGFLGGRRYMNNNYKKQSCFTIYEGKNLAIFQSAPYLERLNNPTPWTKTNAKSFINFTRGACKCVSISGQKNGYGGSIITIRVLKDKDFKHDLKYFDQLTSKIYKLNGIISSALGICHTETTSTETKERKLRKSTKETSLEGVLLIEGYDELILRENKTKIEDIINSSSTNLKSQKTQFYRLSYIQKK